MEEYGMQKQKNICWKMQNRYECILPYDRKEKFSSCFEGKKGIRFVKSFVKQKPHLKRCGFLWVKDRTRTGDLQSHNLAL